MNLKDIFKEYKSPVDEAGWESIAKDPEVVKYNRRHSLGRIIGYSAAALTTVAVVATVVATFVLGDKKQSDAPAPATATTHNTETRATVSSSEEAPVPSTTSAIAMTTAESATPATAEPNAAPKPTTVTAPSASNVPTAIAANSIPAKASATPSSPVPLSHTSAPAPKTAPAKVASAPSASSTTPSDKPAKNPLPEEPETESALYIPNAFSPNGDGLNDLFFVKADFEPEIFEMAIYTRKGEMVFFSKDINIGWDGMRYGTALPFGVYTYFIKYTDQNGKPQNRRGQITLLK